MTDHIGPYELRGELGRGAMAVVWRAWEPSLRREVALKEAHIPHGTSPAVAAELAERFVREARAVAGLSHPNIVTVFSSDVYDGRPVIAMEVIDGDTLSSLLEHGRLSVPAALGILDQLLDGVGYAHSKGVVHRDIKPDNVFVTADGRVKLTDFGIAHVGSGTALTQAGTVMGTPGYMAPEQVTGQRVDARSDIFAIGILGYEMLTGANPFTAGDAHPATVMYRVLNEPLPDLRGSLTEAPESIAALLATATEKDPERRFASAQAMRAVLRGEADVTMPIRMPTRPGVHSPTPRVGMLVAAAAMLVVLLAWFFWRPGVSAPTATVVLAGASVAQTSSVAAESSSTASPPSAAESALPPGNPIVAPSQSPPASGAAPSDSSLTQVPTGTAPKEYVSTYYNDILRGKFAEAFAMQPAASQVGGNVSDFADTQKLYGMVAFHLKSATVSGSKSVVAVVQDLGANGLWTATWTFRKVGSDWFVERREVSMGD